MCAGPLKCHICRGGLDAGARNLDVEGGWVFLPASSSPIWAHERVAAHLSHAGVKETVIRNTPFPDLERALDAWHNREVETAVDIASDFIIRKVQP